MRLRHCQQKVNRALHQRTRIRQGDATLTDIGGDGVPVFVPNIYSAKILRPLLLQHLQDGQVPPGGALTTQRLIVDVGPPIPFEPILSYIVDLTSLPAPVHVVILAKDIKWPLAAMNIVFPCLVPTVLAHHPIPGDVLKVKNHNVLKVEHRRVRRLRNSRTVDTMAVVLRPIVNESERYELRRNPGLCETGKNVHPSKPQDRPGRDIVERSPLCASCEVRGKRLVRIETYKYAASVESSRCVQQQLLPMTFVEFGGPVVDSRDTSGLLKKLEGSVCRSLISNDDVRCPGFCCRQKA